MRICCEKHKRAGRLILFCHDLEQEESMKRVLSILLIMAALVFAAGPIASAQTTRHRHVVRRHRTFWQKHRDKLTVAGTAVAGAGIGGLTGGKKGAAIGTAVGAGSGALYTYKLRKRHRRRY
jgi:uncharacterized protein YcfJ